MEKKKGEMGYLAVPEHHLSIIRYTGKITVDNMIDFVTKQYKSPDIIDSYLKLIDLRFANIKSGTDTLQKLITHVTSKSIKGEKRVILVRKPVETALMMLYKRKATRLKIDICSTLDRACTLLEIPVHEDELAFYIDNVPMGTSSSDTKITPNRNKTTRKSF
ncbi:MAG TPA: hypothetical protein VE912_10930 [Bacteroidales bacterium]|nr:hypothetical protein [Bacteroidales bacterium]